MSEEPFGSKTFCILPWMHTFIDVSGDVKLCCIATGGLTSAADGSPLSLQQRPFKEIWNSPEMKDVRARMMSGRPVTACSRCIKEDAMGQQSYRKNYNQYWMQERPDRDLWLKRVEDSKATGYEVAAMPSYIDVRPGNLCTLACRMCHSEYSNLIQQDPVHSKWAFQGTHSSATRFSDGKRWYEAEQVVIDELLENVEETRMIYLAGGEPLVSPFVRTLIDTLIERGVAGNISIEMSTNVTVTPPQMIEKLQKFGHVRLFLSLDGTGPLYEYIRYPGNWDRVSRNLETLSSTSGFHCSVTTTVQNYNALALPEIFKHMESRGLACNFNLVYSPAYLSVRAMPARARALAAERLVALKTHAERSPLAQASPIILSNISNVIIELELESDQIYRRCVDNFVQFTSDLDRSRGQRFQDVCPELYELMVADGVAWAEQGAL